MEVRKLCVGFSSATRVARFQEGNLEVSFLDEATGELLSFVLSPEALRRVDLYLERWRREEHEVRLLTMHRGELGWTLGVAAEAGGLRDTKFLLARGAPVNYADGNSTALELCATFGHLAVATVLVDAGAHRESRSRALFYAAARGHTAVAELLLDRGADVHYDDDLALCQAAGDGELESVRLLLDRGADVHARYERPMRGARIGGHDGVVALLLERGAARADVL